MRIYLDSIGCRLNQSEIETLGRDFRGQGHELVAQAGEADLAVINTCAVTVDAGSESRKLIRRVKREGAGEVIATGCWATFAPKAAEALPGVSQVVTNDRKMQLVPDFLDLPTELFDLEPVSREPLPGARMRTRAFIKVQDGCDNRCTFCITTVVRGAGQSRPLGDVLADVRGAVEGGAREIVLTGVHLGSWGQDLDKNLRIRDLVAAVLVQAAPARVRLSSLEPWDLDEDFFSLWGAYSNICRHLHLPLQSGCDNTLRRMARKTSQATFRRLVESARAACPEIALTTDLIAGFPGETDLEFSETLAFVEEMDFAGAHVFTYSERPGTAAAGMPGQVPHPVRKARSAQLRARISKNEGRYRQAFIGRDLDVLWENAAGLGPDGWEMSGMSDNALRVTARTASNDWNEIAKVRVTGESHGALVGAVSNQRISDSAQIKPAVR